MKHSGWLLQREGHGVAIACCEGVMGGPWCSGQCDGRQSLYDDSLECRTASCRSQHVMLDMSE